MMEKIKVIFISAFMMIAFSINALAVEIQPNVRYIGETTLESGEHGVSFVLPSGWTGVLPAGSEYFVMQSQAFEGYIFSGIDEMTLSKAQQTMRQTIPLGDGITFHPKGEVQVSQSILDAEYRVTGTKKPLAGHIRTIIGKEGWGIFLIGASAVKDRSKLDGAIRKITQSIKRVASPWLKHLSGLKIRRFFRGSDYHESTSILLCPNGTFYKHFESGGFGGGVSMASEKKSEGRWSVSGGLNRGTLSLLANDGSREHYTLTHEGTKLFLNGDKYLHSQNNCN